MHSYTNYFKSSGGFDRFITLIYEKYKSLSRFSGVIKLNNLKEVEALSLSRFFGENYKVGDDISISIKKFIQIMNDSKYDDFDISVLVEEYLGVKLITNKEKKRKDLWEETNFYKGIIKDNSVGSKFLLYTLEVKSSPYKLIQKRYNKDKDVLRTELINIINLIDNLPDKRVLLPIYASMYTGDPHYLDLDNSHSNLFFYALSFIDGSDYPKTREDKISLLSFYNIDIDNISNYVITYNLLSSKEYFNQFAINKETLILNIQNIITTEYFDTLKKKVFIFENPSILTEILSRSIDASVIISGGFPNSSVYLLMDKLIQRGNKLYYNGDFDPEGLLIAQKLKDRYKDNLELICYDDFYYTRCISKKRVSEERLSKLSNVDDEHLCSIKKLLLEKKYSAYQENNKDKIIEAIVALNI